MTSNDNHLETAFSAWRENPGGDPAGPHLAEADLVRLAAAGGLAEADRQELEHLDHCPACMAAWAAWRRAFAVAQEMESGEQEEPLAEESESTGECAFGLLEAAASRSAEPKPRSLESSCGTWRLEILPDREDHRRGMLVLSRRERGSETAQVAVRDRSGREILAGTLKNNRLARLCERLDELDLSIWTVIAQ